MSNLPTCGKDGPIYSTAMGCSWCVLRLRASLAHSRGWRRYLGMSVNRAATERVTPPTAMKVYGSFWQPSLQLYLHIMISPWHPPNHFLHPKGSSWYPPNFNHHFLHKGPPRPPAVSLVLTMAKGNSATATCDNFELCSSTRVCLAWQLII